jgi:DNA uptake protein ComE-like DNA-binding protein
MAYAAYIYAKNQIEKDKSSYNTLYELRKKQEMQLGIGKFSYTLVDESSKININSASVNVISRLPGLSLELAKAIYVSSSKPFNNKEELLLIDGISEELYNKFKDFITVYSQGGVNINTASQEVMAALDCDEELVNIIDDFRKGRDAKEATKDDQVFKDIGGIIDTLESFRGLSGAQKTILSQLIGSGLIGAVSSNFSLQIETKVLDKPAMRYVIVMDGALIKQWREY